MPTKGSHPCSSRNLHSPLAARCLVAHLHQIAKDPAGIAHAMGIPANQPSTLDDELVDPKHLGPWAMHVTNAELTTRLNHRTSTQQFKFCKRGGSCCFTFEGIVAVLCCVGKWPGTTLGAEGSSKLVELVRLTPGAIGYASSDYTFRDKLTAIALLSKRGEYVKAEVGAFRSAIVAGGLFKNGLEPSSLLNVDGVGVWPIVTATYVLVPRSPESLPRASRTLNFFYRSFLMGDRAVAGTGFAPLPIATQARIVALLSNFKTPAGQSIPVVGEQGKAISLASR